MRKIILSFLLALVFGVVACGVWFMSLIVATGSSSAIETGLFWASGILFASGAGVLLGLVSSQLIFVPVCLGWMLSILTSPAIMSFTNDAQESETADNILLIALLAAFVAFGVWGTFIGVKLKKSRDYRHLKVYAIATVLTTAIFVTLISLT
ncbi:MAG: hypothetical protein Q7N50_00050 [Armatimonadota bacterium]|nr:hypothetical protein [Armatimonadota bacterium]